MFAVGSVAVVEDLALIGSFVEVDRWVNPTHSRKFYRIARWPGRIFGRYDKVTVVVDVGAGAVVCTLTTTNDGCKEPLGHPLTHEIHLFGPVDDITDVLPFF